VCAIHKSSSSPAACASHRHAPILQTSLWYLNTFCLTNPNLHHGLLDKLKAQTLKNGKRIYFQHDDAIIHHTIPSAEAVKILQASGIETHYAQSPITDKLREHLVKCEKAMQSAKPILETSLPG